MAMSWVYWGGVAIVFFKVFALIFELGFVTYLYYYMNVQTRKRHRQFAGWCIAMAMFLTLLNIMVMVCIKIFIKDKRYCRSAE